MICIFHGILPLYSGGYIDLRCTPCRIYKLCPITILTADIAMFIACTITNIPLRWSRVRETISFMSSLIILRSGPLLGHRWPQVAALGPPVVRAIRVNGQVYDNGQATYRE